MTDGKKSCGEEKSGTDETNGGQGSSRHGQDGTGPRQGADQAGSHAVTRAHQGAPGQGIAAPGRAYYRALTCRP